MFGCDRCVIHICQDCYKNKQKLQQIPSKQWLCGKSTSINTNINAMNCETCNASNYTINISQSSTTDPRNTSILSSPIDKSCQLNEKDELFSLFNVESRIVIIEQLCPRIVGAKILQTFINVILYTVC